MIYVLSHVIQEWWLEDVGFWGTAGNPPPPPLPVPSPSHPQPTLPTKESHSKVNDSVEGPSESHPGHDQVAPVEALDARDDVLAPNYPQGSRSAAEGVDTVEDPEGMFKSITLETVLLAVSLALMGLCLVVYLPICYTGVLNLFGLRPMRWDYQVCNCIYVRTCI